MILAESAPDVSVTGKLVLVRPEVSNRELQLSQDFIFTQTYTSLDLKGGGEI